jgi:hypothetical protein
MPQLDGGLACPRGLTQSPNSFLIFLTSVNQRTDHRDMGHDKHDDLDRRLTEAWAKSAYKPDPSRREQILGRASAPKTKRNAQAAKEERWRQNGCYKAASGKWVVPDELMWRSLPSGEDR